MYEGVLSLENDVFLRLGIWALIPGSGRGVVSKKERRPLSPGMKTVWVKSPKKTRGPQKTPPDEIDRRKSWRSYLQVASTIAPAFLRAHDADTGCLRVSAGKSSAVALIRKMRYIAKRKYHG